MKVGNHTNEQMPVRLAGLRKVGLEWVFSKVSVIVSCEMDTLTAARQRKLPAESPKLCLPGSIVALHISYKQDIIIAPYMSTLSSKRDAFLGYTMLLHLRWETQAFHPHTLHLGLEQSTTLLIVERVV